MNQVRLVCNEVVSILYEEEKVFEIELDDDCSLLLFFAVPILAPFRMLYLSIIEKAIFQPQIRWLSS